MNLDLVFWGYTLGDLLLAAGRYTLVISGTLLAIKHATWFLRGHYRQSRSWQRIARAAIELVISASLATLYWRHMYLAGADERLGEVGRIAVVWFMAALVTGLLLTRTEGRREDDKW